MKAGVVWINSTNLFDAMAGFGGYRESGFGREGGREGMFEYLKPSEPSRARMIDAAAHMPAPLPAGSGSAAKLGPNGEILCWRKTGASGFRIQ